MSGLERDYPDIAERGLYPNKEIISETSDAMNKTPDNVVKLRKRRSYTPYLTRKRIKQRTAIIDEGDLHIRIINNQGKVGEHAIYRRKRKKI